MPDEPKAKRSAARKKARAAAPAAVVERAPGRGKYDRSATSDERHREQQNRLLDAAGHVFADVGWADATVEAIVTRAGMSRRTFYEHFDDLRACLLVYQRRATRRAFRGVEMLVQGSGDTPGARLRAGVGGLLAAIGTYPHVARVLFRVARSAGPEFEAAHEEMMSRFARLVYEGVEAAWRAGRLELPPDELRCFALVSGIEAIAMRYVLRGEEQKALEAAPILMDMVKRTFGGTADLGL